MAKTNPKVTARKKRAQRIRTKIFGTSARPRMCVYKSNRHIYVQIIDDLPVGVQLPTSVVIEVIETPPELKGGTATKRPKPAKLSTGLEIMVPEYIGNGEKVWVNTTTGEFAGRAD